MNDTIVLIIATLALLGSLFSIYQVTIGIPKYFKNKKRESKQEKQWKEVLKGLKRY